MKINVTFIYTFDGSNGQNFSEEHMVYHDQRKLWKLTAYSAESITLWQI